MSRWLDGARSISQTGRANRDGRRDVLAPKTGISEERGGCWLQVCLDPGAQAVVPRSRHPSSAGDIVES